MRVKINYKLAFYIIMLALCITVIVYYAYQYHIEQIVKYKMELVEINQSLKNCSDSLGEAQQERNKGFHSCFNKIKELGNDLSESCLFALVGCEGRGERGCANSIYTTCQKYLEEWENGYHVKPLDIMDICSPYSKK